MFIIKNSVLAVVILIGSAVTSAVAKACTHTEPWYYNGNCYETLQEAEAVLKSIYGPDGSEKNQNWRIYFELREQVGNLRIYHLPPREHLPNPAWVTRMNRKWDNWGWRGFSSPYFPTYQAAEAWLMQYAGIPSLEPNGFETAFDKLVYRGTFDAAPRQKRVYSDDDLNGYPMVFDPAVSWWTSCADFTSGTVNTRVGRDAHSIYQPDSAGPPNLLHNNASTKCTVNGVTWRIWRVNTIKIAQETPPLCQYPYASDGTQCVSDLEESIFHGPQFTLEPPASSPPRDCAAETNASPTDETNPCNPADGVKTQTEFDYPPGWLRYSRIRPLLSKQGCLQDGPWHGGRVATHILAPVG